MYKVRNGADSAYIKLVEEEARKFGLEPVFSQGAEKLGLGNDPAKKFEHVHSFADLKDGQGKNFIRDRVNANTRPILDNLFTISNSLNNQIAKSGNEALKEFNEKAVTPAMKSVNTYLDSHLGARVGADGLERVNAKVVSVSMMGAVSRAGDINLHVHYYLLDKGLVNDKELRTLDTRPLFDGETQKRIDKIFQHTLAANCEKELGWKMDIDERGHAVVRGIPNEKESTRHKMASDYLKEHGHPRDDMHFEAAMKFTRPKKPDMDKLDAEQKLNEWQNEYMRVWGMKHQHEHHTVKEASRHESALKEWMKIPMQIVKAYVISKKRGHGHCEVLNAKEFIEKHKRPTLLKRHRNAIRTIRRSKAKGFFHALDIGTQGFWATKPEASLPRGTRVAVHTDAISNRKELQQLKELCALNHLRLRIRGDMSKFQDRRDRDQDRDTGR